MNNYRTITFNILAFLFMHTFFHPNINDDLVESKWPISIFVLFNLLNYNVVIFNGGFLIWEPMRVKSNRLPKLRTWRGSGILQIMGEITKREPGDGCEIQKTPGVFLTQMSLIFVGKFTTWRWHRKWFGRSILMSYE